MRDTGETKAASTWISLSPRESPFVVGFFFFFFFLFFSRLLGVGVEPNEPGLGLGGGVKEGRREEGGKGGEGGGGGGCSAVWTGKRREGRDGHIAQKAREAKRIFGERRGTRKTFIENN